MCPLNRNWAKKKKYRVAKNSGWLIILTSTVYCYKYFAYRDWVKIVDVLKTKRILHKYPVSWKIFGTFPKKQT